MEPKFQPYRCSKMCEVLPCLVTYDMCGRNTSKVASFSSCFDCATLPKVAEETKTEFSQPFQYKWIYILQIEFV